MSYTAANALPVKGVALQVTCFIRDNTGAVLTTLTGLAATVWKDDSNGAAITSAPTEINSSGPVKVELSATEMNAEVVTVKVTASNANAIPTTIVIYTGAIAEMAIPSASDIATAVWAAGTRTLTSFGTLVADIWAVARNEYSTATSRATNMLDAISQIYARWFNYRTTDGDTMKIYEEGADSTSDTIIMQCATGRATNGAGLQTIVHEETDAPS